MISFNHVTLIMSHSFSKELKEFVESRKFRLILVAIAALLLLLIIFQAGMVVGYKQAAYSFQYGNNYYRMFGERGPGPDHGPMMMRGRFIEGHGAVGKVLSVAPPTFVVVGPDNVEKTVTVSDDTYIRRFDQAVTINDVQVGDYTVVVGNPNDSSQIEARFVRLLPPPNY